MIFGVEEFPDHSLAEAAQVLLVAMSYADCPEASRLLFRLSHNVAEMAVSRDERAMLAIAEALTRRAARERE